MTGRAGNDDDLPVFDAIEPTIEDLRGRVSRPGGRQLGPGRGAGVVVAVLVLLVVGIIVGNASLASDPSASPDPSAKNSAVTTDPADLSACSPPRQGQFPSVTLGIEGSRRQVTGLFGFGSGYGHQTQAPGWQVPTAAEGLVIREGDRFVLGTSRGVCFRHVVVDYAVTERVPRSNLAPLFNAPVSPSANSVVVNGLPDGDWTLRVTAHFDTLGTVSDDVVTVSFFRILVGAGPFLTDPPIVPTAIDRFVAPDLFLVGPNGTRFQASPGCGLFIHLANGYEAGDDCGSIGYQPDDTALRVAAFGVIHLDLRGWQITSWSASCGRVTIVDGIETYESPGGCGLGSGSSEGGGPLPDPPAFLIPRGDTVVQIGIGAIDSHGNQFNVSYFAHVIAR